MKLTKKEAEEARRRGLAYEHNMAIEGIYLTADEQALVDEIERRQMGYDEAITYAEDWLRKRAVIPAAPRAAE